MTSVRPTAGDGRAATLAPDTLDALRGQLRGTLSLPGEPGYDQ